MLYLLYLRNGFIKKFPLDKATILVGRATNSDLFLDESFVSKKHARITALKEHILIEDMNSTNGIFIDSNPVQKATVKLNQCFRIGYINFFLKEGNAQEFIISEKVKPVLRRISNAFSAKGDETQEAINLLYSEPLVELLQIGFKIQQFTDLFKHAEELLNRTLKEGCLLLLSQEDKSIKIESQWNYSATHRSAIDRLLKAGDFFQKISIDNAIDTYCASSFPIISTRKRLALLYLAPSETPMQQEIIDFLGDLSIEISLIDSLIEQNNAGIDAGPDKIGKRDHPIPEIITTNPGILNLLSKCEKIAASDLFVIIEGETGTGKELFAKFLHSRSRRNPGNFVALNCAAIPENLMETELFGHEKGAFTDARNRRIGKLELSSGGTLVLDEIGDMPISLQQKLLRAIQEGQFFRVGGNQPIKVDLRIVCLTHKNIKELLKNEQFREDLYYRLAHVTLSIPPLRERKEDIIPLINHFVEIFSRETQIYIKGFSNESIKALEIYDWPGNIRELKNEIKKIIAISENNDVVDLDLLKDEIVAFYKGHAYEDPGNGEAERKEILDMLQKYNWNRSRVSKELNISRPTLYEKLRKYNIN
ncbi:MAG: sigma 54-interacting transcriptional regulator [Candidatus Aminicenantes bacterium]|nr:sigma 54-interacting transcriptional regulator [Candidatus Aminicenantes bacterium]